MRLVNFALDPDELIDRSSAYPERVSSLLAELETGLGQPPETAAAGLSALSIDIGGAVEMDAETLETLQALGYISGGK